MNWKTVKDWMIVLADYTLMIAAIQMVIFFGVTIVITWAYIMMDMEKSNPILVEAVINIIKWKLLIYVFVIPLILIMVKWPYFRTTERIAQNLERRFKAWYKQWKQK